MFTQFLIWCFLGKIVFGQEEDAAQKMIKFIFVYEAGQDELLRHFQETLSRSYRNTYDAVAVVLDDFEEEDNNKVCSAISDGGIFIMDVSWSGNERIRPIAEKIGLPYIKVDASISPVLQLLDMYMDARNTTDVAFIFDNPKDVDEALYYWIEYSRLRMVVTDQLDTIAAERLRQMRPIPNSYSIVATAESMARVYQKCVTENLVQKPERWNLVFLDFKRDNFDTSSLSKSVNLLYLPMEMCCTLNGINECRCEGDRSIPHLFLSAILNEFNVVLDVLAPQYSKLYEKVKCDETPFDNATKEAFDARFLEQLRMKQLIRDNSNTLKLRIKGNIEITDGKGKTQLLAKYSEDFGMEIQPNMMILPVKPFYRIGTTEAIPWSYKQLSPTGETVWTGFCMDFAQKLSELMGFDYEVVEPASGTFGDKVDGVWDGVVGDLARGDTDIALTALIMTADKEEVIDFVAPYFDHTGISVVMRKPIRETSLFKFMTVLKLEVWLSIVGALIITGFMVWILDKYSPYSAKNNKKAYPYPCRDFTLKESFWFALTSFTPQGGGEAPKALSGRTLVAAYWLFVVLMLATFTANLAAFLTVERMQTAVQSLEQLARQSRIKYTVVESSITHSYFINMKNAEDTLYRMWKELTLNASTEDTQYRVWDYPIREQYGHILIAINDSNPVMSAREGFDKVHNNMNGDFAFIHDAMEIKYEMAKSCNLTEVGDLFGEMPYAVGVQQGSHLMDQISVKILDLQRDRFFEHLQEKFWNTTERGDCGSEDSEGISLESLGGVFIATLFGLALAMITLAAEVIYYRRQRRAIELKMPPQASTLPIKKPLTVSEKTPEQYQFKLTNPAMYDPTKPITLGGDIFKPVNYNQEQRRMSHYSLYPKPRNRLPRVD